MPTSPKRARRLATARKLHSEKITVYLDTPELVAIDEARNWLRAEGHPVDRGQIIREGALQLINNRQRLRDTFRDVG